MTLPSSSVLVLRRWVHRSKVAPFCEGQRLEDPSVGYRDKIATRYNDGYAGWRKCPRPCPHLAAEPQLRPPAANSKRETFTRAVSILEDTRVLLCIHVDTIALMKIVSRIEKGEADGSHY